MVRRPVCPQKEEAALKVQQEKDRIRYGKELQAAKREEDALALKRNLEARRIEKEEERKAREKIRMKLGAPHAAAAMRTPGLSSHLYDPLPHRGYQHTVARALHSFCVCRAHAPVCRVQVLV